MTPQQKAALPSPGSAPDGASTEWNNKKMKPTVQRRRSTSSALSKALSKSRSHSSREMIFPTPHPHNGLLSEAVFGKPSSAFILDDRVQLTLGLQTQERHLFLFKHKLVVAKSKSSTTLKLKKQVPLTEVWTGSCLSEVSEKKLSPETSFVIGWPTCNYVATFSSPEVKERWLSALLWHISEMKDREFPKSLPMQMTWMDGEHHHSNTVVRVSNLETVDSAVKMAAQQLGLPGRPSDYHLWVIPGRDNPAYPLIGHEHPFSIILSCLRDLVDQIQGSRGNPLLADEYETILLDQFPRERQCRFLLKPKPQAPGHLRRDVLQKHTRRKKSLIDWALRRSSGTPTGSPASQSPTNPRKLFGLSLTSVCPDGSLPKPIMDILQLLYHEGPSTRGIFRRSANAKVCKELKEKLNSGDDVQVDGESVFVAAAVITDFLRNIPDSVLSSDMHGLWMEAMDKENRVHKIEAITRLVDQLPKANRLLLRYLFGVLHHIQQNATENQMNAFNLALCIAPNMLWLPSPTGPEEESKSTKKVAMLVQFLIENSADIFGGDVALLFQRPEKSKSKTVDDLLAQHNDSSDDMEYATSYQEREEQHYGLDANEVLYTPSGELFLTEDQEDWDLFSEITACYQSKTGKNTSADSYELLEEEEEGSFCSIGSLCSLNPARNRCSSEPSVCLSSQLLPPDHEPVARQSSCDATIMHSHGDYIRRLKELQLESQKLLDEGLSPSLDRARKTFWRSPPQSTSLAKKSGPQKMSLSNRSSFSSLSSTTTTSPSASSLSSLDSAFSYCSESSAFSPTEVPSQPFMFGTSARLQALSPKLAKRSLKEWHKPLVSPLPLRPCHVDFCIGEQEDSLGSSHGEEKIFMPMGAVGSPTNEDNWGQDKKELQSAEMLSHLLGSSSFIKADSMAPIPVDEVSPLASQQVQREKSMKHIEIKCPEVGASSQGSLKRTKITVYMAPKERGPCGEEEQDPDTTDWRSGSGSLSPKVPKSLQTVRVHIPQTLFYGQNTPLVLKSTSRKYQHHESVNQTSGVAVVPQSPLLGEQPDWASRQEGSHLESKRSSNTFSHTFRLFLPASVRKTVREYFSHEASKESVMAKVETVESELIRTRVEWLRSQSCPPGAPAEEHQGLMYAEEAFV